MIDKNPFLMNYPAYGKEVDASLKPEPIKRKVLMISDNPFLQSKGVTVKEHFRWNEPNQLADAYAEDDV